MQILPKTKRLPSARDLILNPFELQTVIKTIEGLNPLGRLGMNLEWYRFDPKDKDVQGFRRISSFVTVKMSHAGTITVAWENNPKGFVDWDRRQRKRAEAFVSLQEMWDYYQAVRRAAYG